MMKNKKDEEKVLKDTKKAADHKKDDLPVSSTIEIKLAEKETELNDAKKQLLMQETKELEEDIIEQNEAIEKLKQQEDIIKKLEEFKKENIDVGYFGKKEGESSKKIDIPLIDGEKDYIGGKETVTTKNKIELLFRKLYKRSKSPMQQILMWYLIITMFGTLLLALPISQRSSYAGTFKFIDLLFIASSAFSDTGLSTIEVSIAFNWFGQAVISTLILIGGVGWFGIKLFILHFIIRKAINHKAINILNNERGYSRFGSTFDVIKVAIIVQIIAIIVFGFAMSITFYLSTPTDPGEFVDFYHNNVNIEWNQAKYEWEYAGNLTWITDEIGWFDPSANIKDPNIIPTWVMPDAKTQPQQYQYIIDTFSPQGDLGVSFQNGYFMAISSINNAGFAIIPSASLAPYVLNYTLQTFTLILLILGGIGFPVIYDIKEYIKNKRSGEHFKFSLITKVSVIAYLVISTLTWVATLTTEMGINAGIDDGATFNTGEQVWILTYMSFSTRNAGFSTIDAHILQSQTKYIFMFSMFVGSSPSSTTGGIRNVTAAVLVLSLFSFMRGRKRTTAFKRTISQDQVNNAFAVFIFSVILVTVISFIASVDLAGRDLSGVPMKTAGWTYEDIVFETFSAFGTTGLTTGITPQLGTIGKICMIMMMFIGQLGISTTIKQLTPKNPKGATTQYPEENLELG